MNEHKIKVDGWIEGFQKVKSSQLLRAELGLNIYESKLIIDRVLHGETVVINCSNLKQAELLVERLNNMGAKVSYLGGSHGA